MVKKKVAVIMGSDSDWPVVEKAVAQLREERGLTETPAWTISYYPPSGQVGLIEFVMGQPPAEENAENLE